MPETTRRGPTCELAEFEHIGIKAAALRAAALGRARCGRAALAAGPAATRRAGTC